MCGVGAVFMKGSEYPQTLCYLAASCAGTSDTSHTTVKRTRCLVSSGSSVGKKTIRSEHQDVHFPSPGSSTGSSMTRCSGKMSHDGLPGANIREENMSSGYVTSFPEHMLKAPKKSRPFFCVTWSPVVAHQHFNEQSERP